MKIIINSLLIAAFCLSSCSEKQREGWQERAARLTGKKTAVQPESGSRERIIPTEENLRFLHLQFARVERKVIQDILTVPAVLEPHPNAHIVIRSPMDGWIQSLPVIPGITVKKNELVAVVENPHNIGQQLKIQAPFAGMITDREVSPGEWVENGAEIVELVDFTRLQCVLKLYPDEQRKVKIGQRVKISRNGSQTSGTISFISSAADPETGAVEARADIANTQHVFNTGEPVKAEIVIGKKEALVIPGSSLIHEEDHRVVFTQQEKGFVKHEVKIGIQGDSLVEVLAGLREGEVVVTRGAYQLKNLSFSTAPTTEAQEER